MNLAKALRARAAEDRPIRIVLVGCGKFATMFLAQARLTPGLHVVWVVDLAVDRARANLERVGFDGDAVRVADLDAAIASGGVWCSDGLDAHLEDPRLDVVIEATGDPAAGAGHALAAIRAGKHVVMVNVEADVTVGPVLAAEARRMGVVYGFAYGDQPALIAELVDWAQTSGLEVVAAGKGTRYLPRFHRSTPETVWANMGFDPDMARRAGMNPKMFNSFVDGTKSAIEMAAVANATGLLPQRRGLGFPACGARDLAQLLRPESDGGVLEHRGTVEVVADLERDGRAVSDHLRWGVYVTFKAPTPYAASCFREYGLVTSDDGYAALWRPFHLIGLELGVSVANAVLRGEATGQATRFIADVVATAKRPLAAGELLDGEGGYTVYGRLMRAVDSVRADAVPMGLANHLRLMRPVARDAVITWADVAESADAALARLRRELVANFIDL
ncbi:MAG: flagellar biosynthesis protein FlgA [Geminicoccaceae bacterium]|nr:MAG: flagellar biosynthesis protein FlgA [Geminicoccaceae bacterium]